MVRNERLVLVGEEAVATLLHLRQLGWDRDGDRYDYPKIPKPLPTPGRTALLKSQIMERLGCDALQYKAYVDFVHIVYARCGLNEGEGRYRFWKNKSDMKKSLAVEVVRHEFPELKACEDDWAVRIWLANACKVYARTARERRELVENVHLARVRRLKAKRRELLRTLHAVRNMREFAGGREDDGVDEEQAWEDDFGEDDFAEDELEEDQDYGYGPREDQGWGINQESPLDRRYGQEEQRERIQFRRPPNAGDLMGVRRNLLGRLEVVRGEVEERRMRRLNEVRRVLLNLGAEGVGDEMREHFEEMARRINPNGEGELLEDGMATREVHERQLELLAQRMVAAEEMRRGVI